ncbi:hypothetical protein Dsin_029495 [Dipteronia sinensis]|uniref:Uncharacterized protein n=1 Tax=Dipteronia sinensis TaxID=43782 RepID=A0AAD9ZSX5_9ROSI|nr:hypothetical protein Dsin_029495 [Dipteronia sinensis]
MESPTVSSSGTSPERTGHHPEALHTITMERTDTRSYASSFQGTQYHKYDSDTSEIQAPREIVAGAASSSQDPQPQHHNFYNWPNLDLLPSKCDHSYEYRLKCVPLHNAALKGDWEEAKHIALKLLKNRPELAVFRDENNETALHVLARKPSSIFKMKSAGNPKLMIPSPALELLKCLLEEAIRQKGNNDIESVTKYPIPQNGKDYIISLIGYPSNLLFDAAKSGNSQLLNELIRSYPFLVHELDENSRSIFHVAILHRHISTFNLIYEMGFDKELLTTFVDVDKNTMLHLAAKYPYHSPVSGLSSAALEMQQELLLFEAVKMEIIAAGSAADPENPPPTIELPEIDESASSSQPSQNQNDDHSTSGNRDLNHPKYTSLRKAALNGDWQEAKHLALKLLKDTLVLAVIRDMNADTALHVLARKPTSTFDLKSTGNDHDSMPTPALQLLNHLCNEVELDIIPDQITKPSNLLFDAVRLGNFKFLDVLIRSFPSLVYQIDEKGQTIFHLAILHRQTDVFDLRQKIGFRANIIAGRPDCDYNTLLHLAAKYSNQSPDLRSLSNAAVEMQKELIWFEVCRGVPETPSTE